LEGGWCKPRVPPKIAKIRLRIIRVCRINGVLIPMGRLKSPYDPSLVYTEYTYIYGLYGTYIRRRKSHTRFGPTLQKCYSMAHAGRSLRSLGMLSHNRI